MNRKRSKKAADFFADKGFYIVLILCIAAIGVSGYILFFAGQDGEGGEEALLKETELLITDSTASTEQELTVDIPENATRETEVIMAADVTEPEKETEPTEESTESGGTPEQSAEQVVATAEITEEKPAASFFVWPVTGEVISPFSVDELVFNKTMEDWRVHTGADISANAGTPVCAIGDGTVEDVYTDEMMGVTVVIDHGNETKSVYQNLMEAVTVAVGDKVRAGDTVGGVGKTAESEIAQPSHLHLEVIQDGARIDPIELLP